MVCSKQDSLLIDETGAIFKGFSQLILYRVLVTESQAQCHIPKHYVNTQQTPVGCVFDTFFWMCWVVGGTDPEVSFGATVRKSLLKAGRIMAFLK